MHTIHWIVICFVCFGLGAALHALVTRELASTKTQLSTWASRLRLAIALDEKSAKTAVEKIATELETKV